MIAQLRGRRYRTVKTREFPDTISKVEGRLENELLI